MKKAVLLALYMTVITLICGSILFYMNDLTTPLILSQIEKEQKSALTKVMPKATEFTLQADNLYQGLNKDKQLCGYVFKVTPIGYGGEISMLVGISNGIVTGISILSLSETPGLGAKANEASFQQQFIAKSIEDAFVAKKDVQAITGSTVTSQAVADGIKTAITNYKKITVTKE